MRYTMVQVDIVAAYGISAAANFSPDLKQEIFLFYVRIVFTFFFIVISLHKGEQSHLVLFLYNINLIKNQNWTLFKKLKK